MSHGNHGLQTHGVHKSNKWLHQQLIGTAAGNTLLKHQAPVKILSGLETQMQRPLTGTMSGLVAQATTGDQILITIQHLPLIFGQCPNRVPSWSVDQVTTGGQIQLFSLSLTIQILITSQCHQITPSIGTAAGNNPQILHTVPNPSCGLHGGQAWKQSPFLPQHHICQPACPANIEDLSFGDLVMKLRVIVKALFYFPALLTF